MAGICSSRDTKADLRTKREVPMANESYVF